MALKTIKAFLLLTIFISACNTDKNTSIKLKNSSQSFNVGTNQTEVKFIGQWLGQGGRERLVREFTQEYGFLHQDIKVVLKFAEEVYGTQKGGKQNGAWIEDALKSDKPEWDIIMINNDPILSATNMETDWPKKYLVDFNEIEEFRNNTVPGLIDDSLLNKWHGIVPGPLIEGFYQALWCNNSVAKKVGIQVKQLGMTFDDFMGYIKAVYEYNQTHKNDYIIPLFEAKDWKTMANLLNQLYASLLDDDNEYFKDRPSEKKLNAWYKTLKALEKLAIYEPLSPKWDTMVWNNNYPLMLKNKCLFFPNGSWMYSYWQNLKNENLKNIMPTEFPVFKPVKNYIGGYQIQWAVPKNAPHKEEAIKFLLAMNTPKIAEKWVRYTKCPTGIKGKLASVSMGVDHFEDFTCQIEKKYGKSQITFRGNQHIFNLKTKYSNNYAMEVLQKKITPEEAMDKIRKTLKGADVKIFK